MRLLRVTAHLRTPVVGDHDIHLDGVLERAYAHRFGVEDAPHRLRDPEHLPSLPIHVQRVMVRGARVTLASAWNLPMAARAAAIHLTSRPDAEDIHRKARAFTPGAGPGRSRLVRREGVAVNRIEWTCWGQRREVLHLLRLVGQLGSVRRGGHGEVMGWEVDAIDGDVVDRVLVDPGGVALRALPGSWLVEPPESIGAWRSPYWHPALQVPCALPGDVVELRPDVIAEVRRCVSET